MFKLKYGAAIWMFASWLDTQTGPFPTGAVPRTTYFHVRTGAPPLAFIGKRTSFCPSGITTDDADPTPGGL
jgi:hypothetical protein